MVCGLCHVLRNDACTAVSVPSLRINRRPVVSKRHNATKATLWGSSLDLTFYIQISFWGGGVGGVVSPLQSMLVFIPCLHTLLCEWIIIISSFDFS